MFLLIVARGDRSPICTVEFTWCGFCRELVASSVGMTSDHDFKIALSHGVGFTAGCQALSEWHTHALERLDNRGASINVPHLAAHAAVR